MNFKNIDLITRRKFLGTSAAIVGGSMFGPLSLLKQTGKSKNDDLLKVALVGSGFRGTGAVVNALRADMNIELVALADIFQEKVVSGREKLLKVPDIKNRIKVSNEHMFVGLDAYKKAIDLADVVILATPPAFRPQHFEEAINADKHVFMEKPLATDSPGIRKILSASEMADNKGLSVVVGLQNRYAPHFQKIVGELKSGLIGDITSISCNYLIAGTNQVPRNKNDTELEYQLRNWRYFEWLWGGSPAGLTIHFEDIAHWVKGMFPVQAFGTGGRTALSGPEQGNIYDNYYIEYEYADGTRLHSRTRHMKGCWTNRSINFIGTKGSVEVPSWGVINVRNQEGEIIRSYDDMGADPYLIEHEEFFKSIRNGNAKNDTNRSALSTMTSIMGRMAVQSGKLLQWEDAFNSEIILAPNDLSFKSTPPVLPLENGKYPIPVPGGNMQVL